MLCGSGLKAVALGYQSIKAGDSKVVLCGGQENHAGKPALGAVGCRDRLGAHRGDRAGHRRTLLLRGRSGVACALRLDADRCADGHDGRARRDDAMTDHIRIRAAATAGSSRRSR